MKKILILLLFSGLFATLHATQRTITGGKWSAAGIQTTDTITVDGSVAPDTIDAGTYTFVAYKRPASNTLKQVESGTTNIVLTGGFWIDSGTTGAKTYPDSIAFTGSGIFRIASGSGAVTLTNTNLSAQGDDTIQIIPASTAFKNVYTGFSGKTTVFSSTGGSSGFNGVLNTGPGATLFNNNTFSNTTNPTAVIIQDTTGTLGGSAGLFVNITNTTPTTLSLPRLKIASPLRFRLLSATATAGSVLTISMGGAINTAGILEIYSGSVAGVVFKTNNHNITTTGDFLLGNSNATGIDSNQLGSSIITCGTYGQAQTLNGAGMAWFSGTGEIRCAGAVTHRANQTYSGSIKFVTTGACTYTANGVAIYDLTDSLGALTFADAPKINNDFTILSGNSSATTWAGYTMSVGGDVVMDGTGTLNMGTGVTMTGNSALLHVGSGVGAVTSANCVITWNGSDGTLDIDKTSLTFNQRILGNDASYTSSGAATCAFTSALPVLVMGSNSALTDNKNTTYTVNAPNDLNMVTLGSDALWSGSGTNTFYINGTYNIAIPTLTYAGSGAWTITGTANSPTINIGGLFTFTNATPPALSIGKSGGAGTTLTFNTNNYDITCGALVLGNGGAGYTSTFNMGSSGINIPSYNGSTYNSGTINLNWGTSKLNCVGSYTEGSNHTITGTNVVRATGTGTITPNGKPFYDFRIVGTPSTKATTVGVLRCAYFSDSSGKFTQGDTIRVDSNYTNVSADSAVMVKDVVIGKNYFRGSPTLVVRTGGSIILDTTFGKQHDFTGSNNQIGPVIARNINFLDSSKIQKLTETDSAQITFKNAAGVRIDTLASTGGSTGKPIRWLSAVAGAAARVWVDAYTATYRYFKDITSSKATIVATDASNTNGTGNTNINFGAAPGRPVLASVTPNHGRNAGGDTISIRGDTLGAVDTVWFLNDPVVPFLVTDSIIKCLSPAHAPTTILIAVHDTNGYSDTLLNAFEFNNLYGWTVTHPRSLDTAGGDTIYFRSEYGQVTANTVFTFDGSVVALTSNTDTLSTYITPAHAKGSVPWIFDALGTVRDGSVRYGPLLNGRINNFLRSITNGLIIGTD